MNNNQDLKRLRAFAALSAVLCLHGASAALGQMGQPVEKVVSADDLVRIALTNNLDIQISKLQPDVDEFAINGLYGAYEPTLSMNATHSYDSQPGGVAETSGVTIEEPATLYRNDSYTPTLQGALPTGLTYNLTGNLSYSDVTYFPRQYEADQPGPGISIDQPLLKNLWIDNTRYTISVAKNTLRTDQQSFRLKVMTVIFNVKTAYYSLIYAREDLRVQQEGLGLKVQTVSDDKQKVRFGSMRPLDEKQAESEAASARSLVQTSLINVEQQENTLKSLLAFHLGELDNFTLIPAEQLIAVPQHPQNQECWRTGLEQRPEMIQAKLAIEKQHVTIKYDFNQLFPQLDVTGSYGRNAADLTLSDTAGDIQAGNHPYYSYGVVLTVPLGNSKARYNYKSDKANLQSLLLQAKKEEWTIVVAIDNDIKSIEADLLKIEYTREARIYAEQALAAGEDELKEGKAINFEVLQYQDNLTSARSAEISALADYNTALEQLALDEGATLKRNHIEVRFR
ncbi:MAG TPA: TolC family protein [Verrucomicrobiae bacterium]|jgi:outer membrane protein TolC|nr:TolC family protein [Verrucomicrobiae bacterium]